MIYASTIDNVLCIRFDTASVPPRFCHSRILDKIYIQLSDDHIALHVYITDSLEFSDITSSISTSTSLIRLFNEGPVIS